MLLAFNPARSVRAILHLLPASGWRGNLRFGVAHCQTLDVGHAEEAEKAIIRGCILVCRHPNTYRFPNGSLTATSPTGANGHNRTWQLPRFKLHERQVTIPIPDALPYWTLFCLSAFAFAHN